jgi:Uma2 family endonuclease
VTTLAQPTTLLTPEEYLAAEREAETRSEYVDGVVYPMTGAHINHQLIVTNLTVELVLQLRGREYIVLPTEMKVRMPDSRKFFYPDITVIGGEPQFHDRRKDIILNPALLVEVLSKSTETFDRGVKFHSYQQLPSLREYLLVAQDEPLIEQYVRQDDGTWSYRAAAGREGSLTLPSVGCTLNLGAVYDKVV